MTAQLPKLVASTEGFTLSILPSNGSSRRLTGIPVILIFPAAAGTEGFAELSSPTMRSGLLPAMNCFVIRRILN